MPSRSCSQTRLEEPLAMLFNMVAIEQPLASLGDYCTKPELAVDQRQVAHVLAVAESAPLLLVIRPCVLVPEHIEGDKVRFARLNSRSRNCGLPWESGQTISPSSTQRRPLRSRASPSHSAGKLLNVFPLRETSRIPFLSE